MSDYGDMCRGIRDARREARAKYGVACPVCREKLPKAHPSILLPQQVCRIHGYRDPRPRTHDTEYLHPVAPAQQGGNAMTQQELSPPQAQDAPKADGGDAVSEKAACIYCGARAVRWCDFIIGFEDTHADGLCHSGESILRCDAPLCLDHAVPDKDGSEPVDGVHR